MTSYQVAEDEQLATALGEAIRRVGPDRITALTELRSAATVGNGYRVPQVPWGIRPAVASTLRATAADAEPEVADKLRGLADGLEESLRARLLNH